MIYKPDKEFGKHLKEQGLKGNRFKLDSLEHIETVDKFRIWHPNETPDQLHQRAAYFLLWKDRKKHNTRWYLKWLAIGVGLLLLILAGSYRAEAQVDCVKWQDSGGTTVGNFCAPFKVKAGSNITFTKSGTTLTIASSGAVAGAGGSDTQVQYNAAGALAGDASFTFNSTTKQLTFTGATGALTGNASTATALAADPADCGANTFANAINASGTLSCTSIPVAALAATSGSGSVALTSSPVFTTPDIGAATGSVSGNAGTATALAADGSNCGGGVSFALGVDASGAGQCGTIQNATASVVGVVSTASQTFAGQKTFTQDNITTTPTDGVVIQNSTLSTSGATLQYSPTVHWTAHVWNTTATAADNAAEMHAYIIPVSGASPTFKLAFRKSLNGGAFSDVMTISDTSVVTATTFVGGLTGLASTATALAANGGNCSGNNFALGVDASGVGECAQPAFSNLNGSATAAQMPAFTGDCTTSAGAVAVTCTQINGANFTVNTSGLATKVDGITTAGQGVSIVQCITSAKSETGADAAVLSCTPAAAVGAYEVCVSIAVSAANTATLGWTLTWTDSKAHANAPTNMSLFQMGVAAPAVTFTAAANNDYYACVPINVNNAGTAIVVKTTFSGTSIAYNITATVVRTI